MAVIVDKIKKADELFGLFDGVGEITVALSGGADSVTLLHSLNLLKDEYGFKLYGAHFNHGIRGEEADSDQEFSRALCEELSVPFFTEKGDVPEFARENGLGLELSARELRYDFLNRVSNGVIATAHTASDNIETIIFNLSRGTSLDGIKGIPPKRDNIIRPLILCSREEIEEYCVENGLAFVIDSTNLIDDCSRNIIRHKVIPVLKEINSSCVQNASKLSVLLNEDSNYLNQKANIEFEKRFKNNNLSLKDFDLLDKTIAKRVIALFYKSVIGDSPDSYHIEELLNVSLGKQKRTSIQKNICGERIKAFLVFSKIAEPDVCFQTKIEKYDIDNFIKLKKIHELFLNCAIDYDKIVGKLVKIDKNSNDLIKLANSNSTKTIKKLLTEKKIPLSERKNLPIFSDDNGIVWAYKIGTSDRVKVDKSTKTVLYFKTEKTGENKKYGNN